MEFTVRTDHQLGEVLRGFRAGHRLTQAELGARVGLAQKAISAMENHPSSASVARLFRVLSALNLELVLRERRPADSRPAEEW